jgi:HD-like signal output (HDOD) protein
MLTRSRSTGGPATAPALAGDVPFPPVPALLADLRALLRLPSPDVEAATALIESDPQLAGDVLRVANSSPQGRTTRAISLRAATTRLGIRRVHGIVETLTVRTMFAARDPAIARLLGEIWRHGVARGTAMRAIASATRPQSAGAIEPETAYLTGLLADAGASLLLSLLDEGKEGLSGVRMEDYLPAIRDNHADIGAALVDSWLHDPALTAGVSDHHRSERLPSSAHGRMLVLAGDLIGPDVTAPDDPPQALVDRCLASLDLDLGRLTALLAKIEESYRGVIEACR